LSGHTYREVDIVGTSNEGLDAAISSAVKRASRTLRHLDWFQVTEIRGRLEDGAVADWQVSMKVGFRLEDV
jgi:dodecin